MEKSIEKNLTLSIIALGKDDISIRIYEPESGEESFVQCQYSPDEHPEFNEDIGNELYSWLSLWLGELDEEDEQDETEEVEEEPEEDFTSKRSCTAYRFGETEDDVLDTAKFVDTDSAIRYAIRNKWQKVVNTKTGELIYTEPLKTSKFTLTFTDMAGAIAKITYADSKEDALRTGIEQVVANKLNLYIEDNRPRPAQERGHFISWRKIKRMLAAKNGDVNAVIALYVKSDAGCQ